MTMDKLNVHWMTVQKAFTFADTHTGFQESNTEKIFKYIDFKPIITSTLSVLAKRTDNDITELNGFLQSTISQQFNFTNKIGLRKNLAV